MKRLTKEDVKKNPEIIYTNYTDIYTNTISNYSAIRQFTFKSMSNTLKEYEVFSKKWKKHIKKIKGLEKDIENNISEAYLLSYQLPDISKKLQESEYLISIIPSNLVVSLVTIFDHFLSETLKYLFQNVNGQINIIEDSMNYNDLKTLNSQVEIQDCFIDKFLDSFFRKSHKDQLEWLQSKLSLNFRNKLSNWDDFMFLCELRNSIIHNNNIPTNYFLKSIDINKYNEKGFNIKPNKQIYLTVYNINFLINTIYLTTTQIYTLISQKYFIKDDKLYEYIESSINDVIFKNIRKNTTLAIELLKIQLNKDIRHSTSYMFVYTINLAICYKKINEKELMHETLKTLDWYDCDKDYVFAKNVILENEEEIVFYMKQNNTQDWQMYYQNWPLFDWVRDKDFFKNIYKEVFGSDFVYTPLDLSISSKDLAAVERKILKNK